MDNFNLINNNHQNFLNSNLNNNYCFNNLMPTINQQRKLIDNAMSLSSNPNGYDNYQSVMQLKNFQQNFTSYSPPNDLTFHQIPQSPQSSFFPGPSSSPMGPIILNHYNPTNFVNGIGNNNCNKQQINNTIPPIFSAEKPSMGLPNTMQNCSINLSQKEGEFVNGNMTPIAQQMILSCNQNNKIMKETIPNCNINVKNCVVYSKFTNILPNGNENLGPTIKMTPVPKPSTSATSSNDTDYSIPSNSDNLNSTSESSSSEKSFLDASFINNYDSNFGPFNNSDYLNLDKFKKLSRLVMRGCELAERIAYIHRHRPCFKKIDSLCARMKQDLLRVDGVLPNINSQGMAWAVKDFIFVFTRIINAWIIIKGYVHNTPQGLNYLKATLSPDFEKSFLAWQDTTIYFVENLIRSYISLNQEIQSQKMQYQNSSFENSSTNSSPKKTENHEKINRNDFFKSNYNLFDKSLDALLINSRNSNDTSSISGDNNGHHNSIEQNEDDLESINQDNFPTAIDHSDDPKTYSYLKTGIYNPIGKDPLTNVDSEGINFPETITINTSTENLFNSLEISPEISPIISESSTPLKTFQLSNEQNSQNSSLSSLILSSPSLISCGSDSKLKSFECNVENLLQPYHQNEFIGYTIETEKIEMIEYLIHGINNLSKGEYFFTINFMKNYFPDFVKKNPCLIDLRSIIIKANACGYEHIFQMVHDLKLIIYLARIYLKKYKNDFLKETINQYEIEIDNILKNQMFGNYIFDHITGDPDESLFNFRTT